MYYNYRRHDWTHQYAGQSPKRAECHCRNYEEYCLGGGRPNVVEQSVAVDKLVGCATQHVEEELQADECHYQVGQHEAIAEPKSHKRRNEHVDARREDGSYAETHRKEFAVETYDFIAIALRDEVAHAGGRAVENARDERAHAVADERVVAVDAHNGQRNVGVDEHRRKYV